MRRLGQSVLLTPCRWSDLPAVTPEAAAAAAQLRTPLSGDPQASYPVGGAPTGVCACCWGPCAGAFLPVLLPRLGRTDLVGRKEVTLLAQLNGATTTDLVGKQAACNAPQTQ